MHLESDDESGAITLGQFFTVWGVRLSASCVGGYCAPTDEVRLYVNGVEVTTTSIPDMPMADGDVLALVVGRPPDVIPAGYDCANAARLERDSCERSFLGDRP